MDNYEQHRLELRKWATKPKRIYNGYHGSLGPLWLGRRGFLWRCGFVLLAAGERDETTVEVSTASKALQTLPHKLPQKTPFLPSPETVQYCCAVQGHILDR